MYTRKILEQIKPFLKTDDVLLFYGARQVGKTTIMKLIQQDLKEKSIFFDLERREHLDIVNTYDQEDFIRNIKLHYSWKEDEKIVIFIDEVQYLDNPTSFLKYLHDHYENIKFIVSGSSTLDIRWKLKDSMVGRLLKFDIFPLSFEEFLIFRWQKRLANLIGAPIDIDEINNTIIYKDLHFFYEEYTIFGAYPKVVLTEGVEEKQMQLRQIFENYIEKDIKDIWKIREIEKFNNFIRILANQSGNLVNISELSSVLGITMITLNEWLLLLENTFVINLIKPFSTSIRGEITKMPKLFFIDNGLRNCINDSYEITGNGFENSFFAYINNAYKVKKINFYRTQDKQEIDFVLDKRPFELKLSYTGKNLTALNTFQERYNQKWTIITLQKRENAKYDILFPREV